MLSPVTRSLSVQFETFDVEFSDETTEENETSDTSIEARFQSSDESL